ncbi:MAG: hypothetical protein U0521_08490 [Anaerolineae bacterium]
MRRVLLIAVGIWLIFACALGIAVTIYGQTDRAQPADVIVVLGSGLRREDLQPGPALTRRSVRSRLFRGLCPGDHLLRRLPRHGDPQRSRRLRPGLARKRRPGRYDHP